MIDKIKTWIKSWRLHFQLVKFERDHKKVGKDD